MNGLIDDVRIYSYVLSEDEIKALYAGDGPGPTKD
ncbi:MAG: LamG domain-containing protein [Planctomycetes bacterium]|nr:LamG domain-containing protein [Planctomycetota bacterium]